MLGHVVGRRGALGQAGGFEEAEGARGVKLGVRRSHLGQGKTLDEVTRNLQEAVALHLADEDLAALGLASNPTVVVTMELLPAHA